MYHEMILSYQMAKHVMLQNETKETKQIIHLTRFQNNLDSHMKKDATL